MDPRNATATGVGGSSGGPGGAQCGAPDAEAAVIDAPRPLPADLARVVAAWPNLPDAVKAGVLAMVAASGG